MQKARADLRKKLAAYDKCVKIIEITHDCGPAYLRETPIPQKGRGQANPGQPVGVGQPATVVPTLTPRQVAQQAFVKIKLTAPTPGIAPPPSINRWKMAAVGYPLWLWGQGATDPPEVTDTIGGLFVSLDPHIDHTDFTLGDGTTLTCTGSGRKWTATVPAGQKSPSCGHVYTKPSLPKGDYTVTATTHWSVDWNANGQTGTIAFVQSASTRLPVGELQVLVR